MADFISVFLDPSMVAATQDRTLQRVFRDTLYPRNLFRMDAVPELWPTQLGGQQVYTRMGIPRPRTRPLPAGIEPTPDQAGVEQWDAMATRWVGTADTNMASSYVALASVFLRNVHQQGLQAGQSINRTIRDRLYNAASYGNTVIDANASVPGGGGATCHVANAWGFTRALQNGRQAAVSATNPVAVIINGLPYNVTAAALDVAGDELHGATLTITPVIPVGGFVARTPILAVHRTQLVNAAGALRIDDITAAHQLTLRDIRGVVARMQYDNIPTYEDGSFHVHVDPIAQAQIFGDNEFQRLNQSLPDYVHYRRLAIAYLAGCTFYRNSECPTVATVDEDLIFGHTTAFELTNPAGINIHRTLITGQGSVEEKYLDQTHLISAAGIQGKVGEFAVTNAGAQIQLERIRIILRSPQDRAAELVSSTWAFYGDFPIPTDELSRTSAATFKRENQILSGE